MKLVIKKPGTYNNIRHRAVECAKGDELETTAEYGQGLIKDGLAGPPFPLGMPNLPPETGDNTAGQKQAEGDENNQGDGDGQPVGTTNEADPVTRFPLPVTPFPLPTDDVREQLLSGEWDEGEADQTKPAKVDVSPAAAALATEHSLDLSTITGSGKDGRIIIDDVRAVLNQA